MSSSHRSLWSSSDDDLLRRFRRAKSYRELSVLLGRTPEAVKTRCMKLGLSSCRPSMVVPDRDEEYMRRHREDLGTVES